MTQPALQQARGAEPLSSIAERYDALILDLWGVIHDGSHLYPGVHDALTRLRAHGKKIVMLSNAPRRASKVEATLNQLGVQPGLYDGVMSSGEAGYRWLESGGASWPKSYYYIGPGKDADVLDGLGYERVDDIKSCGFLLNVGFGSEDQSHEDFMPLLRGARGQGLPMLCLNPDMEVVKITGERYPCAGVIGKAYEQLGGEVTWFGKPFPEVYALCRQWLGDMGNDRILAVGDGLETDIRGAVNFGIDGALVTGGILKTLKPQEVDALCHKLQVMPRYIVPKLA